MLQQSRAGGYEANASEGTGENLPGKPRNRKGLRSAGAAAAPRSRPGRRSANHEDGNRRSAQRFLHGAAEERRGDAATPAASENEQIVTAPRLAAESRARGAAEEKSPLAGTAPGPTGEAAGEVGGQGVFETSVGPPEKIPPFLHHRGLDVGKGAHVGDRDRSVRGSGEAAGRLKRPPGFRREINSRENPESRTRQVALLSAHRSAGGPRLASVSAAMRRRQSEREHRISEPAFPTDADGSGERTIAEGARSASEADAGAAG